MEAKNPMKNAVVTLIPGKRNRMVVKAKGVPTRTFRIPVLIANASNVESPLTRPVASRTKVLPSKFQACKIR